LISAIVVANMIAPPIPCSARAAMRNPAFGASPEASDATAKSTSPIR